MFPVNSHMNENIRNRQRRREIFRECVDKAEEILYPPGYSAERGGCAPPGAAEFFALYDWLKAESRGTVGGT